MRLSIVIPYYNRRELLLNVLRSIKPVYETIIVDDGSLMEHQIWDVIYRFPHLHINIIRLERAEGWRGPCIAYNTGFRAVTGDVILINSSECIHKGDIIGYIEHNFQNNSYMAFATWADDPSGDWWMSHSTNYTLIPYCAAISKDNMDLLGGYDERFAKGIGFDDYEFVDRVRNLGLNTELIDDPYVTHQWHDQVKYTNNINGDLWQKLRREEPDRIKANG